MQNGPWTRSGVHCPLLPSPAGCTAPSGVCQSGRIAADGQGGFRLSVGSLGLAVLVQWLWGVGSQKFTALSPSSGLHGPLLPRARACRTRAQGEGVHWQEERLRASGCSGRKGRQARHPTLRAGAPKSLQLRPRESQRQGAQLKVPPEQPGAALASGSPNPSRSFSCRLPLLLSACGPGHLPPVVTQ